MPSVLVLGGTAEGKALVTQLLEEGVPVIYSVAGLVRLPDFGSLSQVGVPCQVIDGGFQRYGGLTRFLRNASIIGVCDATHPFAQKISAMAWQTCEQLNMPYWRYQRSEWLHQEGDDWTEFPLWSELLLSLPKDKRVFFSAGQLSDATLQWLLKHPDQRIKHVWRTAVEPSTSLNPNTVPDNLVSVKAIGPFDLVSERQLLTEYRIDVLVTKNSGGDATYAKIRAARELGLPVLMLARPNPVPDRVCYSQLDKLVLLMISQLKLNRMMKSDNEV